MSIQGIRPNHSSRADSAQQSQQLERTQSGTTGKGRGAAQAGDRVEVSGDARLMSSAMQAASSAPAIRADKVEAAKVKLANGEVGKDAGRLADAMINNLLSNLG